MIRSFTKYQSGSGTPIVPPVVEAEYTLTTNSYVSAGIYRASDVAPKTLLRTLFGNEYQLAGLQTLYWDGLDDNGNNIIATNDYEAVVQINNVVVDWSVVGNTSDQSHGPTVIHSYSRIFSMSVIGDYVYCGEGYNEASGRAAYKLAKTNIQNKIDILKYPAIGSTNSNDTNLETWYTCSNTLYTFYCGIDPGGTGESWVFAIKNGDNSMVQFANGVTKKAAFGMTYNNVIGFVGGAPTNVPSGMTCNDDFLWLARGSQNAIYAYDLKIDIPTGLPSGALLSTTTGFVNAQELTYNTQWSTVWTFVSNFVTNGIFHCSYNVTTGALSSNVLTVSDFPSNKLTMAMDNINHVLLISVGGSSQQVWGYNVAPQYPAGTKNIWKIGQAGGNCSAAGTPLVSDDTFLLSSPVTNLSKAYLAVDPVTGDYYIGDPGNNRTQRFDSSRNFVDSVLFMGALYSISSNMTDPNRVYGYFLEFDSTTKELKRNYRDWLTSSYISSEYYDVFKYTYTAPNGRTYSTIPKYGLAFWPTIEIVELTTSGITFTGVYINNSDFFTGYLTKDFVIRESTSAGSYAAGSTATFKQKIVTYDGSGLPIIGSSSDIFTTATIVAGDAIEGTFGAGNGITTTNEVAIVVNRDVTTTCNYHLEAYNSTTGAIVWRTFRKTTKRNATAGSFNGYRGVFTDERYYDIGNDVANTIAYAQVCEDITATLYYGEFWGASQTNYINLYSEIGLPIVQMGIDLPRAKAIEESYIGAAGNALSWKIVKEGAFYYVYHGDESIHSAIHKWKVTGIPDIQTITVAITPPTSAPTVGTYLMGDLTLNSVITSGGLITRTGAETADCKMQSGATSYDKYYPEASMYLKESLSTQTTSLKFDITPSIGLTAWEIVGEMNFRSFEGVENLPTPTAILQAIDSTGKVIAQTAMGRGRITNMYELTRNNDILLNFDDANTMINTVWQWQPFRLAYNGTNVIVSYGNYPELVTTLFDGTANPLDIAGLQLVTKTFGWLEGQRTIAARQAYYIETL